MTYRFTKLFLLLFICVGAFGQDAKITTTSGGYADEMTVNSDQNKSWRMGQNSYSAKPKNAWEVGLHTGHFFIDGDVDRRIPGGYGIGLHLRKAIHYVFSVRGDIFYGQAKGLETQLWTHVSQGGGLVEQGGTGNFQGWDGYKDKDGWFPSHRTREGYIGLQAVINVGNLLFHKERNKWNWYTTIGTALSSHQVDLDLKGADGQAYSDLNLIFDEIKFNQKQGRREIWKAIDAKYDGVYETEGFKKNGIFRVGDETNIHVMFTASMGVSRKLSKRFNLGLEHQVMATDNDYLDGIKFRTEFDQTNHVDMMHYTNLRLGINLGNFSKISEPLYWLNPLDAQMSDIAALKQRPVFDLTDTDGDGVIDMMDQEMDTQAGAPVDTRGIALDSDNDGIKDFSDKEPFSPTGYAVDKNGIADVKCCINMDDVNKAIDAKVKNAIMNAPKPGSECGKWFLPMIHYDLDKSNVKPEFYGHLHHVASVMKMCPDICVTAHGHTDVRSSNNYNNGLSYSRAENAVNYIVSRYGIDRSRFKVMYGGEDNALSAGSGSKEHLMNRRVEFRVCAPEDSEMARPEGASSTGRGKSVKGAGSTKYVGNKNSGY
jgi:OmpA-OmpF porin, OOP family